jgi:hypothetical protein
MVHWAEGNYFKINIVKTEMMIYRKGGKLAARDKVFYKWEMIKSANSYKYLGITLLTRRKIFTVHIREKALWAIQTSQT